MWMEDEGGMICQEIGGGDAKGIWSSFRVSITDVFALESAYGSELFHYLSELRLVKLTLENGENL